MAPHRHHPRRTHLWAPHVIEHDDRHWMFVCAGGPSPDQYRIHLATSDDDCWTWTRREEANPIVVDGFEARDPMVLRIEDRWVLYYTAASSPTGGNHVVAALESDDLVLESDDPFHFDCGWGQRGVYLAPLRWS